MPGNFFPDKKSRRGIPCGLFPSSFYLAVPGHAWQETCPRVLAEYSQAESSLGIAVMQPERGSGAVAAMEEMNAIVLEVARNAAIEAAPHTADGMRRPAGPVGTLTNQVRRLQPLASTLPGGNRPLQTDVRQRQSLPMPLGIILSE